MVARVRMVVLVGVGLLLWVAATASIRLFPAATRDPALGAASFAAAVPLAWLSILLIRGAARLARDQLVAGVAVVGAVAMTIDGAVLRWAPSVYGPDDTVVRAGAAWLLWGYGVSLGMALAMATTRGRRRGA